jgi:hypothetical protein
VAYDTINNGVHARYTMPIGMVLVLAPLGTNSQARATSSVSGFGPWGPTTTPIQIGPLSGAAEIVVEVMQGTAIADVVFPSANSPVTVTPSSAVVGDTLTATLATGWTATGFQWNRDGVPISGATAQTYTLGTVDGGHLITLTVSGLVYTPTGVSIPPITVVGYDGGASSTTFVGDPVGGGSASSAFVVPPISGGTA